MLRRAALVIFLIVVAFSPRLYAQSQDKSSAWQALQFIIGEWDGVTKGKTSTGTASRTVSPILDNRYLFARSVSSMGTPHDSLANGKEDWGLFSWDKYREKVIYRQFQSQGFVYYYVLDSIYDGGNAITFSTERIENVPDGWTARLTFKKKDNDHFTETFELSPAMMSFDVYMEKQWTRKKEESQ